MAELVDAADSKSAVRKDVLVRFQSRAQNQISGNSFQDCLFYFPTKPLPVDYFSCVSGSSATPLQVIVLVKNIETCFLSLSRKVLSYQFLVRLILDLHPDFVSPHLIAPLPHQRLHQFKCKRN